MFAKQTGSSKLPYTQLLGKVRFDMEDQIDLVLVNNIKGNGYTFRESSSISISCLLFSMRSILKGKNLLPVEQILSFKNRLFWKILFIQGRKQEAADVAVFDKMAFKHGDVPVHPELSIFINIKPT